MNEINDVQYLSGTHPVTQALLSRRRPLFNLFLSAKKGAEELVRLAGEAGVPVQRADNERVGRMAGTSRHQGAVLECGPLPTFELEELTRFEPPGGKDLIVLLSGVEDPQNLGAVVRTCSFLGTRALVLPAKGAAPLSPAASRASAGALEAFPVAVVRGASNACASLTEAGYEVVGVEKGGAPLAGWEPAGGKVALVVGSEDKGLGGRVRSACSRIVTIEGEGPTGSLNLSVAAGIAINHVIRQMKSS
ncbi:MAG: RNA methyltransferase [bacterium]|nr:RNA methyltransferase [bacterium]